jgi:dienelactone hydrolase
MPHSRRHFLSALFLPAAGAKPATMPNAWTASPTGSPAMPVWSIGSGPAVLLMHEINGLSPADIACGEAIAAAGPFRVYMPLLFGRPGREQKFTGLFRSCASRGFDCTRGITHPPVLDALLPLSERIAAESGGPIGAIGMCLTGAFPLALLRNPRVVAPVLAQPSLPFPEHEKRRGIGLSVDDIVLAVRRDIPILGLRYKQDSICTPIQFEHLSAWFGNRFEKLEIDHPPAPGHRAHSTLAYARDNAAFSRTIEFLRTALAPRPIG